MNDHASPKITSTPKQRCEPDLAFIAKPRSIFQPSLLSPSISYSRPSMFPPSTVSLASSSSSMYTLESSPPSPLQLTSDNDETDSSDYQDTDEAILARDSSKFSIFFAKGQKIRAHPPNKLFTEIIITHIDAYYRADGRQGKRDVIERIYNGMALQGYTFYVPKTGNKAPYHVVTRKVALAKIAQSIRDRKGLISNGRVKARRRNRKPKAPWAAINAATVRRRGDVRRRGVCAKPKPPSAPPPPRAVSPISNVDGVAALLLMHMKR